MFVVWFVVVCFPVVFGLFVVVLVCVFFGSDLLRLVGACCDLMRFDLFLSWWSVVVFELVVSCFWFIEFFVFLARLRYIPPCL